MSVMILCAAYFFQLFDRPQCDWNKLILDGFGLFMAASTTYTANTTSHRIAFVSVVFGCMLFDTVFLAMLIVWCQKRIYEPPFKSIGEIIDGGYDIGGDQFVLSKLLELNQVS